MCVCVTAGRGRGSFSSVSPGVVQFLDPSLSVSSRLLLLSLSCSSLLPPHLSWSWWLETSKPATRRWMEIDSLLVGAWLISISMVSLNYSLKYPKLLSIR